MRESQPDLEIGSQASDIQRALELAVEMNHGEVENNDTVDLREASKPIHIEKVKSSKYAVETARLANLTVQAHV